MSIAESGMPLPVAEATANKGSQVSRIGGRLASESGAFSVSRGCAISVNEATRISLVKRKGRRR